MARYGLDSSGGDTSYDSGTPTISYGNYGTQPVGGGVLQPTYPGSVPTVGGGVTGWAGTGPPGYGTLPPNQNEPYPSGNDTGNDTGLNLGLYGHGSGGTAKNVQAGGSAPTGGTDLASLLSGVYQQYGLDPNNPGAGLGNLDYFMGRANATNPNDTNYWTNRLGQEIVKWQGGGSGNLIPNEGGYGGTNVFSDPATQQYEKLLNSIIGRFNTPYTPPDFQNSIDYLNQYFKQLQGPAYTPDQLALMQTQQFDPLMAQRDAADQQIIQRFGAQGMGPGSGPVQAAILQNHQKFDQLGTQARAGVANNAIGVQKQQQAQAAALGPQIANLESANYNAQNQNMLQAASLAGIVPQLAWNRLQGANSSIQPLNPSALLNPLYAFQQQGYNQGSDYMSQLMQALTGLFGGSGLFQ